MRVTITVAGMLFGVAVVASAPVPAPLDILSQPLDPQQQELRTTINAPSGRPPRLAIPAFLVEGGQTEVQAAAKTIADVLWKDLECEREYQMIDQTVAATIAPVPPEALAYEEWMQTGADEVLVASVQKTGAALQVDVRLMNIAHRMNSFAKRYACPIASLRLCAHTISDEVHKERFGLDGVARTKLAFTSDRDAERLGGSFEQRSSVKEIYIADYDGERVSRVTTRGSLNLGPAWSPDSRAFAYQSYQTGFADIFVQKLYDVKAPPLRPAQGTERAQNYLPAWSPDGSRIAFVSSRDGDWEIYVVKVDGSDRRRLTSNPADDGAPTWSPSGNQIAFTSDRGGSNQIYIMSADGGPVEQLTSEPMGVDRPTWSRNNVIAYTVKTVEGTEIQTIDLGTRQVVALTNGPGTSESPSFAPNGRHIAFVSTRWGKQHIAIMDVDGQNVRQITFAGNNRFPTWSAGPREK
jgi:TolB protein